MLPRKILDFKSYEMVGNTFKINKHSVKKLQTSKLTNFTNLQSNVFTVQE